MSSGCRSLSCVDARAPVRASYKVLYKWPESDAEFLKSVAAAEKRGETTACAFADAGAEPEVDDLDEIIRRRSKPSVAVVDGFSCRQLYLRSYTFTKKETVPEKTKRCFRKVRQTAAVFGGRSSEGSESGEAMMKKRKKRKKRKDEKSTKKEDCANTRKLRSALRSLFRGLLACTATVDVVD